MIGLLHPDVVLRVDFGPKAPIPLRDLRGAQTVAEQAAMYGRSPGETRAALVNGAIGDVRFHDGKAFSILAYTVANAKIIAIDILADPARLAHLDLPAVD